MCSVDCEIMSIVKVLPDSPKRGESGESWSGILSKMFAIKQIADDGLDDRQCHDTDQKN